MPKYIIAGGDIRYITVAEQLSDGNDVSILGFEKLPFDLNNMIRTDIPAEKADVLILPMPASRDRGLLNAPYAEQTVSLDSLSGLVKEKGIVFGGRIPQETAAMLRSDGLTVYDYMQREELAVLNALATAEGAVQIALREQPAMLSGENILITGMGRIARSLIRILGGFGVYITVAARKQSDLAWAEVLGCKSIAIDHLDGSKALSEADVIFNTVPSMILDEKLLAQCSRTCLLMDLASAPGGIDLKAAEKLGLNAIWELSLPGRTAPASAGRIIADTIKQILSEHNLK